MWLTFLNSKGIFNRSFFDFDSRRIFTPVEFYTDASRNERLGCGGICFDEWFILQWNEDFIRKNQPSIAFLELYALTAGLLIWLKKFENQKIIVYCDNQSVVNMINKNVSSCQNCMVLIRMVVFHMMLYNVKVQVQYVRSKDNTYADLLSRLKYDTFRQQSRKNQRYFKGKPEKLPEILWPMDKLWIKQRGKKRTPKKKDKTKNENQWEKP